MLRYTKIALVTAALATGGAMAFAAKSTDNDAIAAAQAKVSLTQAIAVAEQHAGGKASRAEYEKNKTGWAYDIEVISGAKVFDVQVDGDKGTVISSREDKADHDDGDDKAD
ncbi:MAG: peptidase M4 [Pseudomonas sp.]|nr:peptidase M4 [Pseudomonas sp.]